MFELFLQPERIRKRFLSKSCQDADKTSEALQLYVFKISIATES